MHLINITEKVNHCMQIIWWAMGKTYKLGLEKIVY